MPLKPVLRIVCEFRFTNAIVLGVRKCRFDPKPVAFTPIERSKPSEYPVLGWWQVAQATSFLPDKMGVIE